MNKRNTTKKKNPVKKLFQRIIDILILPFEGFAVLIWESRELNEDGGWDRYWARQNAKWAKQEAKAAKREAKKAKQTAEGK